MAIIAHESHDFESDFGFILCTKCGVVDWEEAAEEPCPEEPRHNPYDRNGAWSGGFADNH